MFLSISLSLRKTSIIYNHQKMKGVWLLTTQAALVVQVHGTRLQLFGMCLAAADDLAINSFFLLSCMLLADVLCCNRRTF